MRRREKHTTWGLQTAAVASERGLWPTPRHEGFDAGGHRGSADSLHAAVKGLLPTPTATMEHVSDMKQATLSGQQRARMRAEGQPFDSSANGGKLSPAFVESLMLFPLGYTLPDGDPLHLDPDWEGDPLNAAGRGLEYREPLTVASAEERTNRLKALGNAVVAQIPYLIFQAIEEAER